MPRSKNSENTSNYHYCVKKYSDETHTQLVEKKYFRTQKEICSTYNINRSGIYYVINPDLKRLKRLYQEFDIQKLTPPIPIYETVEIQRE